jgi:putative serine protease PepD
MNRISRGIAGLVAATLVVGAAAAAGARWPATTGEAKETAAQRQLIADLQARVTTLEADSRAEPDWPLIASTAEPSVVTIQTADALGSGWVFAADSRGSDILTNFHVVDSAWTSGSTAVEVLQKDRSMSGRILRVDTVNDLALVHVAEHLTPLATVIARARPGAPVMAIGSPLGLDDSVSVGYVSGYRSLGGSDYMQFTAPINPGNSGGPVIDAHGRVVAVATAKLMGTGLEGLGFAIPIAVACGAFVTCR